MFSAACATSPSQSTPGGEPLVRCRHERAEREREVALLRTLQLRRDPLDERREAADRAVGADDRRHAFHLLGARHTRLLPDGLDRGRVREDEVAGLVEDPHRRRMEHRRAEDDVGERVLRVLARLSRRR